MNTNDNMKSKGLKYPFCINAEGSIGTSDNEDNIEESIRIILGTAKGERVMREDFGCGINELLFSANNAHTRNLIVHKIEESLKKWEPRIDVINVEADAPENEDGIIRINIEYRVISSGLNKKFEMPFGG